MKAAHTHAMWLMGISPYTYRWQIWKQVMTKALPSEDWFDVGTNSQTFVKTVPNNLDYRNFRLRCYVTNQFNYQVLSSELYVVYLSPDPLYKPELENIAAANQESVITETNLFDNYPNPFNPTTTINYQLPENGYVTIKVYDLLGKEMATLVNENKSAGYHRVNFDASKLTSGVYVYTIQAGNYFESKKMLLTK